MVRINTLIYDCSASDMKHNMPRRRDIRRLEDYEFYEQIEECDETSR